MLTYADSYVCSRMLTQALHGGKASELAVRRKEAQWEQVLTLLALLVQKYNPEASKLSTRFSDASRRRRRRSIARSCCCALAVTPALQPHQTPAQGALPQRHPGAGRRRLALPPLRLEGWRPSH